MFAPPTPRVLALALFPFVLAPLARAQSGTPPAGARPGDREPDSDTAKQAPDRPDRLAADRIRVTAATRIPTDPLDVPFSGGVIDGLAIRERSYRTLPQSLRDTPGIMVQETAHGHGSPYIRGFTSRRTLLLVDGIRINHSAFREGPNQYWNTVDPLSLDRIEIVKGPSSVLYGSDAIGGTVSAFTADPTRFDGGAGGSLFTRYSDAENSIIGRLEVEAGWTHDDGSRTGTLLGGSVKHYGDLEAGASTGVQAETGYEEEDLDIKVVHHLDDDRRFVLYHQRVRQDDVPRTHRTIFANGWRGTSIGSDLERSFDQSRQLSYLRYEQEGSGGLADTVRGHVSWQQHGEVRTRVRGSGSRELQGFDIGQLGVGIEASSAATSTGTWTYGIDYTGDFVDSFFSDATPTAAEAIQGPVGDDARYDLLGAYVQNTLEATDRLNLILGARFNYVRADANSVRDPATDTQISIDDDWSRFVGSARFRFDLDDDRWRLFGGISQGFRAPNLSDLTRFDSARSDEFEIPAPGLDAEDYISYEFGLRGRGETFSVEATAYYLDVEDRIVRFPTGVTNAAGDREVTKANAGDGAVWGLEFGGSFAVHPTTQIFGNLALLDGDITNFESPTSALTKDNLTRQMPLTLQTGARWEEPLGRGFLEAVMVHADKADELSFGDRADTSRIPAGGTPSYTVLHLRSGWQVSDATTLHVLLENATDDDYRVHGSGLNRPGRNFVVSVSTTF